MARKRNRSWKPRKRSKVTSRRVARDASKIMRLAKRRGMQFFAAYPKVRGTLGREFEDITAEVEAVAGTALVQTKGKRPTRRRK